jgi:hypothetical protein
MRLFILLFGIIFISAKDKPGSGTAYLKCKSESGKTIFNADLQDITGQLESAEFSVDNKKIKFDGNDDIYTVFDAKNGVFTIYIHGKTNNEFPNHKYIVLWAIPSSFKTINGERAKQKYEFEAKIYGTEPRKDQYLLTPTIKLKCTLVYEI